MNSSSLPFTSSEVSDFGRFVRITMAMMSQEIDRLDSLRLQYILADGLQQDVKRDAYMVLIREQLKEIRTKWMDLQTEYFKLMNKCNEL